MAVERADVMEGVVQEGVVAAGDAAAAGVAVEMLQGRLTTSQRRFRDKGRRQIRAQERTTTVATSVQKKWREEDSQDDQNHVKVHL